MNAETMLNVSVKIMEAQVWNAELLPVTQFIAFIYCASRQLQETQACAGASAN